MKQNLQNPDDARPGGETREIAFNCKFFLGDRPACGTRQSAFFALAQYRKIERRLLIIKLDAMGDVLRTTALLAALAEGRLGMRSRGLTVGSRASCFSETLISPRSLIPERTHLRSCLAPAAGCSLQMLPRGHGSKWAFSMI
jgi:hypothetical protein